MPEGPDLAIAASYIRRLCDGKIFSKIVKSTVSKCMDIPWNDGDQFTLTSVSRGKELMLTIHPLSPDILEKYILFHFGMSGRFIFDDASSSPKHAHFRFFTSDDSKALNFVDTRRFGKWELKNTKDEWSPDRGPCPLTEYELFRENVLRSLDQSIFDRPLCEVMLDQRFFNGIGNYLRAEIIYRVGVPPFEKARTILEAIRDTNDSKHSQSNAEKNDLLSLCRTLQEDVVALQSTYYTSSNQYLSDNDDAFDQWLQCYGKPNMHQLVDSNKRTIWFSGPAGPLAKRTMERRRKRIQKKNESVADSGSVEENTLVTKATVKKAKKGKRMEKTGSPKRNGLLDTVEALGQQHETVRETELVMKKTKVKKEKVTKSKLKDTEQSDSVSNTIKKGKDDTGIDFSVVEDGGILTRRRSKLLKLNVS